MVLFLGKRGWRLGQRKQPYEIMHSRECAKRDAGGARAQVPVKSDFTRSNALAERLIGSTSGHRRGSKVPVWNQWGGKGWIRVCEFRRGPTGNRR